MKTKTRSRRPIMRRGVGRAMLTILGILLAALFVLVVVAYQGDIRRAHERISVGSQVIETACGPIEYAAAGSGQPVLVAHGSGGGYDAGLDLARGLIQGGFRVIAMSRFGYLRTPLPADASPAAQADAYACLLDALGIKRAAVVGASGGAPSSMQFALRHADRTTALVLLVPAAYPISLAQAEQGAMPKQTPALAKFLIDNALKSDFLFWAAPRVAPKAVDEALLATPPEVIEHTSADERARIAEIVDHLLPFSARRLGVLNDAANENPLPRYDLEQIAAPTLILSAADDIYGTYEGAQYSAKHIPHARFIGYSSGGHVLAGHYQEAVSEIVSFLRANAP